MQRVILLLCLGTLLGCTDMVPGRAERKAQQRQVKYLAQDVEMLRKKNRKLEDQLDRMRAKLNQLAESHGQGRVEDDSGTAEDSAQPTRGIPKDPVQAEDFTLGEFGGADTAYRGALLRYEAGDFDGARRDLEKFLDQYPQSDLADNAQYWIGECYYAEKDYEPAAEAFHAVGLHFPFGNKVPDAYLKAGMSYLNIGRNREARESFVTLADLFPGSVQDQKAETYRRSLERQ